MYDKHDYSLLTSLSNIFDHSDFKMALSSLCACSPFTIVDIGCGFSLRYTGHVLFALARNGITNISVHVVDPALYGHSTHLAIGEIKKDFPNANFHLHPKKWSPQLKGLAAGNVQFAIAMQTTTLFNEQEFSYLHANLSVLLDNKGIFIDISEIDDRVTDRNVYPYLTIYSRTIEQRVNTACDYGFSEVVQTKQPAHATAIPDGQLMVGLAFSKSNAVSVCCQ